MLTQPVIRKAIDVNSRMTSRGALGGGEVARPSDHPMGSSETAIRCVRPWPNKLPSPGIR